MFVHKSDVTVSPVSRIRQMSDGTLPLQLTAMLLLSIPPRRQAAVSRTGFIIR